MAGVTVVEKICYLRIGKKTINHPTLHLYITVTVWHMPAQHFCQFFPKPLSLPYCMPKFIMTVKYVMQQLLYRFHRISVLLIQFILLRFTFVSWYCTP